MGYAQYLLPDGTEAGYGVRGYCERSDCGEWIDRGLGCLCGRMPVGHRKPEDWGCGKYFCGKHLDDHDCTNKRCGFYILDPELEEEHWVDCENPVGDHHAACVNHRYTYHVSQVRYQQLESMQ